MAFELSSEAARPIKRYLAFKNKHELSLRQFLDVVYLMSDEKREEYYIEKDATEYLSHVAVHVDKEKNYWYSFVIDDTFRCVCLECGVDLGEHSTRQLCGKTYCCNSMVEFFD